MREHSFPPIRTARLTLRPAVPADAAPLAALMTPAISARLASWPIPWTASQMRARIAEWRAIGLSCTVRRTEDAALVGWVHALRKRSDAGRATMGWWCAEPHQGRGYIREAAAALLPVAFDRLGVTVVEAGAQPDNLASFAVMRALGMRLAGERMDLAPARGREERVVFHEIDVASFRAAGEGACAAVRAGSQAENSR